MTWEGPVDDHGVPSTLPKAGPRSKRSVPLISLGERTEQRRRLLRCFSVKDWSACWVPSSVGPLWPPYRGRHHSFFPSGNITGRRQGCAVVSLLRKHKTYHCTRSRLLLSHNGRTAGKRRPDLGLRQKYCCLASTSLSADDSGRRTGDVQVTWYAEERRPQMKIEEIENRLKEAILSDEE